MNDDIFQSIALNLVEFSDLLNVVCCSKSIYKLFQDRTLLQRHLDKARVIHNLNIKLLPVAVEFSKRKKNAIRHTRYIPKGYPLQFPLQGTASYIDDMLKYDHGERPWVGFMTQVLEVHPFIEADSIPIIKREGKKRAISLAKNSHILHSFVFGEDHKELFICTNYHCIMILKDVKKGVYYYFGSEDRLYFLEAACGWNTIEVVCSCDEEETFTMQCKAITIESSDLLMDIYVRSMECYHVIEETLSNGNVAIFQNGFLINGEELHNKILQ